jgi:preprotein translocase subunit SecA
VARVGGLLGGVFGGGGRDGGEATRKKYADTVARINAMEPEVSALSDADLRARTAALQERARAGESLDSLLPVRTLRYGLSHQCFSSVKIDIKLTTLPYL